LITQTKRIALLLLLAPLLQAAVVLQYHHVDTATPASTSTSPERFAMHLDYLEGAGFEVVPLQALVDRLRKNQPLPDRAAAITFDDGYLSIYEKAWPLLKTRGWPFTIFINTEPHDQRRPLFMSWDQLRELHEAGATVANHTVSHPYLLRRQPGQDEAQWNAWIRSEIVNAQQRIEEEIGEAPLLFAYPFGEFDNTVLNIVGELGFAGFGQQSGPLAAYSDIRALPRFPFGGPYGDGKDFATKVNSLPLPLANLTHSIRWSSGNGLALNDLVIVDPNARPVLELILEDGFESSRLACFVSGQGRVPVTVQGTRLRVQAIEPLPNGRSRYNCTAPSDSPGRYYWFSQPWIIRQKTTP
jgi:biofilm PGA synthesis lipoprotein PgaB